MTDLILKIYDRKSSLDDLFEEITYDTRMIAKWSVFGIIGKAYGNLHL